MHIKDITWNEVNGLSQTVAIVLFVGVFVLGFLLGKTYEYRAFTNAQKAQGMDNAPLFKDIVYTCDGAKTLEAVYHESDVDIFLLDKRHFPLKHAVSASGARYTNADESIVFWNKGTTARMTEGTVATFTNCIENPS